MIWKNKLTTEQLNSFGQNSLGENLGMKFVEIGDDYLKATMPVDHRTVQPFRLLHGGASVSLAETLGSVASMLCIDMEKKMAVGLEINANHLKSVREGGMVTAICTPIRVGANIHVWNIDIFDEKGNKVCISRLTCAVIDKK
jgi:1,4-dihydroxy-2-naphthoyl-CoA hydrolase